MEAKKLEAALKTFEKIKVLDAEIIELDRVAMVLANNKITASFELKVKDLTAEKEEKKAVLDSDGSLVNPAQAAVDSYLGGIFRFGLIPTEKGKEEHTHKITHELSNGGALHLLSVVLADKCNERDRLLAKLKQSGVTF